MEFVVDSIEDCNDHYLINDWWDIPMPATPTNKEEWVKETLGLILRSKIIIQTE